MRRNLSGITESISGCERSLIPRWDWPSTRRLTAPLPCKPTIGFLTDCFSHWSICNRTNQRRDVNNSAKLLSSKRCTKLHSLNDEMVHRSRCGLSTVEIRRRNELRRDRNNSVIKFFFDSATLLEARGPGDHHSRKAYNYASYLLRKGSRDRPSSIVMFHESEFRVVLCIDTGPSVLRSDWEHQWKWNRREHRRADHGVWAVGQKALSLWVVCVTFSDAYAFEWTCDLMVNAKTMTCDNSYFRFVQHPCQNSVHAAISHPSAHCLCKTQDARLHSTETRRPFLVCNGHLLTSIDCLWAIFCVNIGHSLRCKPSSEVKIVSLCCGRLKLSLLRTTTVITDK
jgi:hypothetical protein